MRRVLTVIVTYNGMQWIGRCIDMLEQSTLATDIFVVDNCSTDGTPDFIENGYQNIILKRLTHNVGFGQGNNLGFKYALQNEYDYVLLLNQDAYLAPDALQLLMEQSDEFNLLTPLHLNGQGDRLDHNFRESIKRSDSTLLDDLLLDSELQSYYYIGESCAACWFMPTGMIREIGGFNPLFHQYGEDNNYFSRLIYHGRKNKLVPKARMCHDRTNHGNNELYNRKEAQIRVLKTLCDPGLGFFSKCYRCFDTFLMFPLNTIVALVKMIPKTRKIWLSIKNEKQLKSNWL